MKHNKTVSIDKKRDKDGIVSCQQVGVREKLMRFLLGKKEDAGQDSAAAGAAGAAGAAAAAGESEATDAQGHVTYIGNKRKGSRKFHYPDCDSVKKMNEDNKVFFHGDRQEPIDAGYEACKNCNP